MRLTTVNQRGELVLLTADDFDDVPRADRPRPAAGRLQPEPRSSTAARSPGRSPAPELGDRPPARSRRPAPNGPHPVETDPDLRQRMRAAGQSRAPRARARRAVRPRRGPQPLAGAGVRPRARRAGPPRLRRRRGTREAWRLTAAGGCWRALFHESDLLVAECLHAGLFDGARRGQPGRPALDVRLRAPQPGAAGAAVVPVDRRARSGGGASPPPARTSPPTNGRPGWPSTGRPTPGFAAAAYAWVAGEGLADVVADEELTGGDFVRTMKQLIDLARQLALVAPDPRHREAARRGRGGGPSAAWSPTSLSLRSRPRAHEPLVASARRSLGAGRTVTIRPGETWGEPVAAAARSRRRGTPTPPSPHLARRRPPAAAHPRRRSLALARRTGDRRAATCGASRSTCCASRPTGIDAARRRPRRRPRPVVVDAGRCSP